MQNKTRNKRTKFAQQIRKMKVGDQFTVANASERITVSQLAKDFHRAGFIDFTVTTKEQDGGSFVVVAIP